MGDTATPMRPITPPGSPLLRVRSVHVSPPSVDLNRPLQRPPLVNPHGVRCACHKAAYRTRGLDGSSTTSIAPALSDLKRIFCPASPPSPERNTPRAAL